MIDVLNLALPYYGLIFPGYAAAKWRSIPDATVMWLVKNGLVQPLIR